ncbi:YlbE family protein [Salisediminibacterium selenitireducens]|uniref:DUF1116 domain-containing protein n=1 Tax=Bacillus selenitireducens (strain ATCC 700615 / DSM 15326 / MLS10) TaxID=439292 RepID=D6XVT8_BACIE|nr:DUF1116 domain-containing protein [Salisediminibacterium selenitireducens]ADH97711.1 protein of unknown function DUF1116 [[Bacillus] selenitireducens MLS10]
MTTTLFQTELKPVNIGTDTFKQDLTKQGLAAVQVDWRPPAGGNLALVKALDGLMDRPDIDEANKKVTAILKSAHPVLVDMQKAIDVIPGMHDKLFLHAGPPIEWARMCGPMQGAIIGAILFEGLADNEADARKLAESGELSFAPCHSHQAVGPMAGVLSPSMPVHVVENKEHGNRAYCSINEGLGKVLRYGAFSEEVINRLTWLKESFMPVMQRALQAAKNGIDLKALIAQALHMGDEVHNRNKAATSLFIREMLPYLMQDKDHEAMQEALSFMNQNDHYFLNLSMPACKASLDAAHGVKNATIVTTMARNGVDFGIRVSGLGEDEWFTAPANYVKGLVFPGFKEDDAAPDIGDSTITETMGIGGFTMGGAPAIVQFVGGTVSDAMAYSEQMYQITTDENSNYSIPTLDFRGSPVGIDVRKVIDTNILPIINTGMAHKTAGVGQVGAGLVEPPAACFEQALMTLANEKEAVTHE